MIGFRPVRYGAGRQFATGAAFNDKVRVMRVKHLKALTTNISAFFAEVTGAPLADVTEANGRKSSGQAASSFDRGLTSNRDSWSGFDSLALNFLDWLKNNSVRAEKGR